MTNRILINSMVIPMAPTMNTYWRTRVVKPKRGGAFSSTYVSDDGVAYKKAISELMLINQLRFGSKSRLRIEMVVCMRDKRAADIDNRIKPLQDALKEAGVFADDEQVDELIVKRGPIIKDGKIILSVVEITPDYSSLLKVLDQAGGQS